MYKLCRVLIYFTCVVVVTYYAQGLGINHGADVANNALLVTHALYAAIITTDIGTVAAIGPGATAVIWFT